MNGQHQHQTVAGIATGAHHQHKQPQTNLTLCQLTQNVRVKMAWHRENPPLSLAALRHHDDDLWSCTWFCVTRRWCDASTNARRRQHGQDFGAITLIILSPVAVFCAIFVIANEPVIQHAHVPMIRVELEMTTGGCFRHWRHAVSCRIASAIGRQTATTQRHCQAHAVAAPGGHRFCATLAKWHWPLWNARDKSSPWVQRRDVPTRISHCASHLKRGLPHACSCPRHARMAVATRRWCHPSPSRCRTHSESVVSTCKFRRPRRGKQDARGRPLRKPAPPVIDDVVRELPPFTSAKNQPRLWRHWLPSLLRCAVVHCWPPWKICLHAKAPQAARHPQGETKAPLGHPDPCHAPCRSTWWEPGPAHTVAVCGVFLPGTTCPRPIGEPKRTLQVNAGRGPVRLTATSRHGVPFPRVFGARGCRITGLVATSCVAQDGLLVEKGFNINEALPSIRTRSPNFKPFNANTTSRTFNRTTPSATKPMNSIKISSDKDGKTTSSVREDHRNRCRS